MNKEILKNLIEIAHQAWHVSDSACESHDAVFIDEDEFNKLNILLDKLCINTDIHENLIKLAKEYNIEWPA